MKALRLSFALVLTAFAAAGCSDDTDTPSTAADTGTAVIDTGTAPTDTGTAPMDTGTTPVDTGGTKDTTVSDTAMPTKHSVDVGAGGNTFSPGTLSIKVGDTVEWTWKGDAHTVTETTGTACVAKTGGVDSGLNNTGHKFSHTFGAAGTFNYMCTPHCGLGMKGTITIAP